MESTQFTVTIKNKSQNPIEKFSVYLAAKAKGRTIPLAENEIRFEHKAGIEPNETKSATVKANSFMQKKWSALTHEEINEAEVVAELVSATFYKEEPIKSDTTNAKNANVDDNLLKLEKLDLPKPPKIQIPQKPVNIKRLLSTNRR